MDNTLINIRIKYWHIQWEKGKCYPTIRYNSYHRDNKTPFFEVYNFFGFYLD